MSTGTKESAVLWLLIWTANNIGVTLLHKWVFQQVKFKFPFFSSFVHMVCYYAGSEIIFHSIKRDNARIKQDVTANPGIFQQLLGQISRKELDRKGKNLILAFSVIFSLSAAIGKVIFRHVSLDFYQAMRSLVPALTIAMGLCLGRNISIRRQLAVLPIVVGVAMACFVYVSCTALGFFYTVCFVTLAALKEVASGVMLTGSHKLHPVDLLGHMAPLAMIQCLIMAFLTGETTELMQREDPRALFYPAFVLILTGLCSFTLNISSLMVNKLTSPLTLCIAENVKQVVMLAISNLYFYVVSPLNGAGILVVLIGAGRYSYVSVLEKQQSNAEEQVQDEEKDNDEDSVLEKQQSNAKEQAQVQDEEKDNDEEMAQLMTPKKARDTESTVKRSSSKERVVTVKQTMSQDDEVRESTTNSSLVANGSKLVII